ncbi:MAG: hypothetical protein MUP63_03810 [Candidatus Nanohaloarchaeota archaeon QJJ-7]|nr:hypothetical protein [Candidatus Nanohaloarchaeota archaeon QJJ-7]
MPHSDSGRSRTGKSGNYTGRRLEEGSIDMSKAVFAFDHDGNVHTHDIGQDYLLDVLSFGSPQEFIDAVEELRDGSRTPESHVYNGENYSEGEELGIFLAEHEVPRGEVRGRAEGDGFREAAPEFINDILEYGGTPFIISAGDQDFLEEFYGSHGKVNGEGVEVVGTKQQWKENGGGEPLASGILEGNGKEKKPQRFQEAAYEKGLPLDRPVIASGDSEGDRELFRYAQENGGIAIGTGGDASPYTDVVVEGDGWYGQIASSLGFIGMMEGLDRSTIVEETASYLSDIGYEGGEVDVYPGGVERLATPHEEYEDIKLGEETAEIAEEALDDAYNDVR